ncbi:competence protein CoiA [Streptococcus tangpeifui]|uniref:competence protein CoiA n=1 Tax=Streptococcus tangpeifui TaxID=2709400 RepID=UPI0013E9FC34|nr:competence protein CoiA family protein [Streptococcus sp. ZJ373]
MLVAKDNDGHLVSLLEGQIEVGKAPFTCPGCGALVRLKKGKIRRPYFAHLSLKNCQFFWENEGQEHLGLKSELYRSLKPVCQVRIEVVLPDLQQVADLLVEDNLALEVQCSTLSRERLKERTHAYRSYGFQVRWLLGKKLWLRKSLTALQKDFLYFSANIGFHLWELDLAKRCLRLKYLIYEDWHGHVHYLIKECPFSENCLDFLRQPYVRQPLASYKVKMDQQLLGYIQRQLYSRNPRWLKRQAQAYERGDNLLAKSLADYYPQVRPPKGPFCQMKRDLTTFENNFLAYYQTAHNQTVQVLYPPAFYDKIEGKSMKGNFEKVQVKN